MSEKVLEVQVDFNKPLKEETFQTIYEAIRNLSGVVSLDMAILEQSFSVLIITTDETLDTEQVVRTASEVVAANR